MPRTLAALRDVIQHPDDDALGIWPRHDKPLIQIDAPTRSQDRPRVLRNEEQREDCEVDDLRDHDLRETNRGMFALPPKANIRRYGLKCGSVRTVGKCILRYQGN